MGAGSGRVGVLCVGAVLSSMLGLAPPARAGGDGSTNAGEGNHPEQGVTYSGRVSSFSANLTAIAPTIDGGTELLVHFRLECDDVRGSGALDETLRGAVEPDGSFSIDLSISTPPEGGVREAEIHVSGRFRDGTPTKARFSYDLYDEDDEGTVAASCEDNGELQLSGGRANRGLARVEVGIPVEADDRAHDEGQAVTSADAVFVGLTTSFNEDGVDSTELFRIDPTTNQVVAHQTVPVDLDELVVAGSSLFGIDVDNGTLVPVDASSLTAGSPIQIEQPTQDPDEDFPLYAGAAAIDGTLWLSATRDQELVRVDPASGAVVARVPLDAHPAEIVTGPTGLYVETQTSPIFQDGPEKPPQTNVVRRIDPATGAVLATSPSYPDRSIGTVVATADAVVMDVTPFGGEEDELVQLDPETLAVRSKVEFQYPIVGAPPGVWTTSHGKLPALRPNLSRVIVVPDVVDGDRIEVAAGFEAIWLYNDSQQSVYRIAAR